MCVKVNCYWCGSEVIKEERFVKKYEHSFCNLECHHKYIRSKSTLKEEKCSFCGERIFRNNFMRRNSKTGLFFCSNTCKNIYLARNLRWSGNPYYHRSRKKFIFEKANKTCQKCGYNEDERMLDLHHVDGNHHNNDFENIRCVCVWCHIKHHREVEKITGILPVATKDDFDSYLHQVESSKKAALSQKIAERNKKRVSYVDPFWRSRDRIDKRKVTRPNKEELECLIWQKPTMLIAKEFCVSDKAVEKWCKRYGIVKPARGYWNKLYAGKLIDPACSSVCPE